MFCLILGLAGCRPAPAPQLTTEAATTQATTRKPTETTTEITTEVTTPAASEPETAPTSESGPSATSSSLTPTTVNPVQTTRNPGSTTRPATVATTVAPLPPTSTPVPVVQTTAAPVAASNDFPYKNYGTLFRNEYGMNSAVTTQGTEGVVLISTDTGTASEGVVLVKVDTLPGDVSCIAQLTGNGATYQYNLVTRGSYVGLPLQFGNGSYTLKVAYNLGDVYVVAGSFTFDVALSSSLKPFTASSIITDFSTGSACVAQANALCGGQSTLSGKVDAVYRWVSANISYDRALANSISSAQVTVYLPDPDRTYNSRTGICYDYASLMCAMLRSQGIATKLIMGNALGAYHAWNEVYFDGVGWVVVADFSWTEQNGGAWVRLDTTFAASGMTSTSISQTSYSKSKTY